MWSIDKVAHRVIGKGQDATGLGRWVWVRYRGKDNITLRVYTAYRPNPPSEGPFTVYAQHRTYFNAVNDTRCPRKAFVEDLMADLQEPIQQGDNIIVMLDGNEDMREGFLADEFKKMNLREVIMGRHGTTTPSTFDRNSNNTPIDGIWSTPSVSITAGGYLPFDEVFEKTNHRTLWVDITYVNVFGYNMFPIIKHQARRLQCKDPRSVANYNRRYEQYIKQHNLLQRARDLEANSTQPLSDEAIIEFEELDKIRCTAVKIAVRKCRKLRMGQVDFSPTIQLFMRKINAWQLLYKRAQGKKVSSRLLSRSIKKAKIDSSNRIMGKEYLQEQLHSAYKNYYQAKSNHGALRASAMHTRAEALAAENNTDKAKILQTLMHHETQRKTAKKIKYLRGKVIVGSTSIISVTTPEGGSVDITKKEEMERAIMEANEKKYKCSFHTPFMVPPLLPDFGYIGTSRSAQEVLMGEYVPPPTTDSYAAQLINHLNTPIAIQEAGHHPTTLPIEEYQKYWLKARERTSSYPGDINFSTLKAGARNETIAQFECIMTRIPLFSGYSPTRWRQCVDVMILKKAGLIQVDSLRTIVLFQADCNYAFKYVGREMMSNAEKHESLAPEQYGSRKNHRSIDLATNKALSNDLLRQQKSPGAVCSNDAKSCYDLIGHTPASIAMQRQGVPKSTVTCMFTTLQELKHKVRTAYGDSESTYGGSEIIPMHGVMQGNGAGPAIWAVVSTPILSMLRTANVGSFFRTPISNQDIRFVGYSFVDDTDLIQTPRNESETCQDVIEGIQHSLNTWEGGLRATGGAIVPEKSFWYLVDFKWKNGNWYYRSREETEATLRVKDIQGNIKELKRIDYHQAMTTLGVDLAPDGNLEQQARKMKDSAILWADQMRTGKLSRTESWIAFHSTLWRSLEYPLPALNLTKKQCEEIMSPALNQFLPSIGVCRNFPRSIVFAPLTVGGLGIAHLYTTQETARITNIIDHTANMTDTGKLHLASLENLIIETGFGNNTLNIPYQYTSFLATDSLIKSTWQFLSENDITLKHNVTTPTYRENDKPLMQVLYDSGVRDVDLFAINKCRLYMKVYNLSDIFNLSGSGVKQHILQGTLGPVVNAMIWPKQGYPTTQDWEIWRSTIRRLMNHDNMLLPHLGHWNYNDSSIWFYSVCEEHLFKREGKVWLKYRPIKRRTRNTYFELIGTSPPASPLFNAYTSKYDKYWVCHGYSNEIFHTPTPPTSLHQHITRMNPSESWCINNFEASDNGEEIAEALKKGEAIAVCDGSYKDEKGASAWVLEGATDSNRIKGYNQVPGATTDQSPYRSELAGLLGTVTMITEIYKFHHLTEGQITVACDNISALNLAFDTTQIITSKHPDHDLLFAIRHKLQQSKLRWNHTHVRGHQDDKKLEQDLNRLELLNIEMDKLAKSALKNMTDNPPMFDVVGSPWSIWIQETKIVKDIPSSIYNKVHGPMALKYWETHGKSTSEHTQDINWGGVGRTMKALPLQRRWFITKHLTGMCGVGKFLVRWKEKESSDCPRCGAYEDAQHVWLCCHVDVRNLWKTELDKLLAWLVKLDTDPEITEVIIGKLRHCFLSVNSPPTVTTNRIRIGLQRQQEIGWVNFMEGFIVRDWQELQHKYYSSIRSLRTGRRWHQALLNRLWDIAWKLWEHRNHFMHEKINTSQDEVEKIDRKLVDLYNKLTDRVSDCDSYLLSAPLHRLKAKGLVYKKEWIQQAKTALAALTERLGQGDNVHTGRQQQIAELQERRNRRQRMLGQMQSTMRAWLGRAGQNRQCQGNETGFSPTPAGNGRQRN
jgi:hypothetical protein